MSATSSPSASTKVVRMETIEFRKPSFEPSPSTADFTKWLTSAGAVIERNPATAPITAAPAYTPVSPMPLFSSEPSLTECP